MFALISLVGKRCLLIQALAVVFGASVLSADEVHHVGAGQQYSSIMDALLAIPKDLAGRGEVCIMVHRKSGEGPWIYTEKVQVQTEYDFDNEEEGKIPGFKNASTVDYIKIAVADGDRHGGMAHNGVVIEAPDQCEGDNNCLRITVHYTVIDGFATTGCDGESPAIVNLADHVCVKNVLVHNIGRWGCGFSFRNYDYHGTIQNCILYNIGGHGIVALMNKVTIDNTTIYNCGEKGIYGRNILARNVISAGNNQTDFGGSYKRGSCNNLSSDYSAPGSNTIKNIFVDDLFKSISTGNEDLHLIEYAAAIDHGAELTVALDIDGDFRPQGDAWDIGADEFKNAAPFRIDVDILIDEDDGDLSPGDISLREAIKAVQPSGVVSFVKGLVGVIPLTLGQIEIDKGLAILAPPGKKIAIDAQNDSRIFMIDDGNDAIAQRVNLIQLKFVDGNVYDSGEDGGAILNKETLSLPYCKFENCRAFSNGGAISSCGENASLEMYQTDFYYCEAEEKGGAIYNEGDFNLHSSIFYFNFVGDLGAAFFHKSGNGIFDHIIFRTNISGWTGAIHNEARLTIDQALFSDNGSCYGAGIYNSPTGILNVENCTFSHNFVEYSGGAIHNDQGIVDLSYLTITDNQSNEVGCGLGNNGGTVTVKGCIVAENLENKDLANDFISEGYNIIGNGDGATGFIDGVNNDMVGSTVSPFDPRLNELADNYGFSKTHELMEDSPAINAGNPDDFPVEDQRGMPRPQHGAPDIGAFEVNGYHGY
ncbi:MAG: hypothetical protein GF350_11580 [Chitinivibrionales bacterium]|nr:hypothetical protein [Chitinivibrionales bacterium]